ncbi:MAG: hypothetical protein R3228_04775 [Halioglobus sp.]|nr:hypothetical protein [Halioglobus sp.]
MVTVRFFARFREELGCGSMQLDWREDIRDLDALQEQLCLRGGE